MNNSYSWWANQPRGVRRVFFSALYSGLKFPGCKKSLHTVWVCCVHMV
jgi:hypothetical protein